MPRKLPTEHRHAPPTPLHVAPSTTALVPSDTALECPNDARIAALERQFARFQDEFSRPVEHLPAVIQKDDGAAEHNEQRFASMQRQIQSLREQVGEVQDLPRLTQDDINNLTTALNTRVNSMIEDVISREVTQIKIRMSSMERSSSSELAKDVESLGRIVSETGKLLISIDARGRNLENEVLEAKAAFNALRREFNTDLSNSLRLVVDSLQGAA
jgi:uncharacterized coiled-coil protein SlyX